MLTREPGGRRTGGGRSDLAGWQFISAKFIFPYKPVRPLQHRRPVGWFDDRPAPSA